MITAPEAGTTSQLPWYAVAITFQNFPCTSNTSLSCQYVPNWVKHKLQDNGLFSSSRHMREAIRKGQTYNKPSVWRPQKAEKASCVSAVAFQSMPEQSGGLNFTKSHHRTETETRKIVLGLSVELLLQRAPCQQLNYNIWSCILYIKCSLLKYISQARAHNMGFVCSNEPPLRFSQTAGQPNLIAACW